MSEPTINWSAYARHYDLLCSHNDSYSELLDALSSFLSSADLPENPLIVDVGAGTGNFSAIISETLPDSNIYHIDANREMNLRALSKYELHDHRNITIIESDVLEAKLDSNSVDLIICINCLYAMNPQALVLEKFRSWLKPSGLLYVVDLGREMKPLDWGLHFFRRAQKKHYVFEYLKDAIRGREVVKQNRTTRIAQLSGEYWMHDTIEFGNILTQSGYNLLKLEPCYRDYADLAICQFAQ